MNFIRRHIWSTHFLGSMHGLDCEWRHFERVSKRSPATVGFLSKATSTISIDIPLIRYIINLLNFPLNHHLELHRQRHRWNSIRYRLRCRRQKDFRLVECESQRRPTESHSSNVSHMLNGSFIINMAHRLWLIFDKYINIVTPILRLMACRQNAFFQASMPTLRSR